MVATNIVISNKTTLVSKNLVCVILFYIQVLVHACKKRSFTNCHRHSHWAQKTNWFQRMWLGQSISIHKFPVRYLFSSQILFKTDTIKCEMWPNGKHWIYSKFIQFQYLKTPSQNIKFKKVSSDSGCEIIKLE